MNRRGALKTMTLATGGGLLLPLCYGCDSDDYVPIFFTKDDILLLNEIGETILPKTINAPGARELKIAHFMDTYVADCYSLEQQEVLQKGLVQFKLNCQELYSRKFSKLSDNLKTTLLINLDKEAQKGASTHYFFLLKKLVVFSYFTSKEGMEQALNYLPIPEKYIGDYPSDSDTRAWAL